MTRHSVVLPQQGAPSASLPDSSTLLRVAGAAQAASTRTASPPSAFAAAPRDLPSRLLSFDVSPLPSLARPVSEPAQVSKAIVVPAKGKTTAKKAGSAGPRSAGVPPGRPRPSVLPASSSPLTSSSTSFGSLPSSSRGQSTSPLERKAISPPDMRALPKAYLARRRTLADDALVDSPLCASLDGNGPRGSRAAEELCLHSFDRAAWRATVIQEVVWEVRATDDKLPRVLVRTVDGHVRALTLPSTFPTSTTATSTPGPSGETGKSRKGFDLASARSRLARALTTDIPTGAARVSRAYRVLADSHIQAAAATTPSDHRDQDAMEEDRHQATFDTELRRVEEIAQSGAANAYVRRHRRAELVRRRREGKSAQDQRLVDLATTAAQQDDDEEMELVDELLETENEGEITAASLSGGEELSAPAIELLRALHSLRTLLIDTYSRTIIPLISMSSAALLPQCKHSLDASDLSPIDEREEDELASSGNVPVGDEAAGDAESRQALIEQGAFDTRPLPPTYSLFRLEHQQETLALRALYVARDVAATLRKLVDEAKKASERDGLRCHLSTSFSDASATSNDADISDDSDEEFVDADIDTDELLALLDEGNENEASQVGAVQKRAPPPSHAIRSQQASMLWQEGPYGDGDAEDEDIEVDVTENEDEDDDLGLPLLYGLSQEHYKALATWCKELERRTKVTKEIVARRQALFLGGDACTPPQNFNDSGIISSVEYLPRADAVRWYYFRKYARRHASPPPALQSSTSLTSLSGKRKRSALAEHATNVSHVEGEDELTDADAEGDTDSYGGGTFSADVTMADDNDRRSGVRVPDFGERSGTVTIAQVSAERCRGLLPPVLLASLLQPTEPLPLSPELERKGKRVRATTRDEAVQIAWLKDSLDEIAACLVRIEELAAHVNDEERTDIRYTRGLLNIQIPLKKPSKSRELARTPAVSSPLKSKPLDARKWDYDAHGVFQRWVDMLDANRDDPDSVSSTPSPPVKAHGKKRKRNASGKDATKSRETKRPKLKRRKTSDSGEASGGEQLRRETIIRRSRSAEESSAERRRRERDLAASSSSRTLAQGDAEGRNLRRTSSLVDLSNASAKGSSEASHTLTSIAENGGNDDDAPSVSLSPPSPPSTSAVSASNFLQSTPPQRPPLAPRPSNVPPPGAFAPSPPPSPTSWLTNLMSRGITINDNAADEPWPA